MRTLVIASVLISLAAVPDDAWSEQLTIGPLAMGMPIKDVIGERGAECTTEGMLNKYKMCKQSIVVAGVRLDAKCYFDAGTMQLVAVRAEFGSTYYDQIKEYLNEKYNIESSIVESMYGGNKILKHQISTGYFILKYKDQGDLGSLDMMSAEGERKHAR